jgi:predicted nucleotidyltransferase component of viral defense system
MSVKKPTNMAASVRAKLKNYADRERLDFQSVLTRYGIERFLYRLSRSRHADRFILKGASLFVAWAGHPHRATRDLDLLGFGASDVETVVDTFQEIIGTEVEADGLVFDPAQTRGAPIKEGQKYRGVRLHLIATLGNARVPVQVDVGFGDAVEPDFAAFPTLIDLPAPQLRLYPRETVVAEKLHAMVVLGLLNGRLKDYYDVWHLSQTTAFDAERLGKAIARTFAVRSTPIPDSLPDAMTSKFVEVPGKTQMWSGFVRKAALPATTPVLSEIVAAVGTFAWPIFQAEIQEKRLLSMWQPGEGWIGTNIQ